MINRREPAMPRTEAPLAVVTGVSRRVGFALAEHCAAAGFDLLITAPDDGVDGAAVRLRGHGGVVEAVRADLGDPDGVDELCDIVRVLGRPVDALVIGPGRAPAAEPAGAPSSFFDRTPAEIDDAVDVAVLGPVRLAHRIGGDMRHRGAGRILFACAPPAADISPDFVTTFGANAFLAGLTLALRQALDGSGVTVTCLPPQLCCAGVDGGRDARARGIARLGFDAMMRGDPGLSPGVAASVGAAGGAIVGHGFAAKPTAAGMKLS